MDIPQVVESSMIDTISGCSFTAFGARKKFVISAFADNFCFGNILGTFDFISMAWGIFSDRGHKNLPSKVGSKGRYERNGKKFPKIIC